jgi:hypothetical protein
LSQQLAQLQTDSENFSNRLAEIGDGKKLSDEQFNELLKLRGEVGMLRQQTNEIGKLRAKNQQLQDKLTTSKNSATSPSASQTDFSKESWAFAGYTTPAAAMETWIWAMDKGDKKVMLASLTPDQQPQWQKILDSASDTDLAKGAPFTAFHIVSIESISDEEINLTIVSDLPDGSKTGEQKYTLKQIGTDWKMAGPTHNQ